MLDRELATKLVSDEYGECSSIWEHEDGTGAALTGAVWTVEAAITTPAGVQLQIYHVDLDAVVVCVREHEPVHGTLRQIAGYSIETRHLLLDPDRSPAAVFDIVEAVLENADALVPKLRALQRAERQSDPSEYRLPAVCAYHGDDGAIVVEIDTADADDAAHDSEGMPYLRVWVNEALISDGSPPASFSGSPRSLAIESPASGIPIGRLVVETPPSPNAKRTPDSQR